MRSNKNSRARCHFWTSYFAVSGKGSTELAVQSKKFALKTIIRVIF